MSTMDETEAAFSIALRYTAFLDAVTIRRMYTLIVGIFLLSIVVYLEFLFVDRGTGREARVILNGPAEVTMEAGSEWEDPGAEAV